MKLYDLHCHSKMSLCASQDSEISDFLKCAEADGLACIGISDHAWDKGLGRAIGFYTEQPYINLLKRERPSSDSVKVFLGAEGEYAQGLLGIKRPTFRKFDYIIIPHSHIHMKGFVLPVGIDDDASIARYLFNSYVSLLHHPDINRVFGIAHPFWPCGKNFEQVESILSQIDDEEFAYCGRLAKARDVFLEMNMSCVSSIPLKKFASSQYARFFRYAKEGGAEFFMGSDNHKPQRGRNNCLNKLPKYAAEIEFTEEDFKTALSRILRE